MANTYIVHSANPVESFPFLGSWETFGVGYGVTGVSDISNQGSISSNTDLDGYQIWAIGGIQSGFGYSDACTAHPQICIVMEPGADQSLFTNVSIQLDTANSPTIFESSSADLYTQLPTLGTDSSNWVWTVANVALYFVNGHNTTVIFGVTAPLPTMTLDAVPVSDSEIDLSWTDSSSPTPTANNYNISRDGTVIAHLANTVFSFNDTGLNPSTTYSYEVTGVT